VRHYPRKRFGQNFLIDDHLIASIIHVINPASGDRFVEIGPGMGALTQPLLTLLEHLHVVEIDRDIVQWLRTKYSEQKLTIYAVDALKFDFSQLGPKLRIIGNLPYNISTPLLFHLSQYCSTTIDMHFMLQQEVVDRMVAEPSTSEYGRLSVMLQNQFEMEKLLSVPATSFHPIPKVESAIVRMIPHANPIVPMADYSVFSKIVTAAFSQRRKTLRNTLKNHLDMASFAALQIDPSARAENLSVFDYATIVQYLKEYSRPVNII